jgi:hypothetical protein
MTDSSEALNALPTDAPERRFIVSRSGRMTRKLVGGPTRLNSRMLRMIQLMAYGNEDDPEHTPYDVADAAKAVGYQARAGRALMNAQIFSAALAAEVEAMRRGEHARSLRTIVNIRDEVGENTAADRRVRLEASRTLIGGDEGKGLEVNVNVQSNTLNAIRPGYIVRLPADLPPRGEGVAPHARTVDAGPMVAEK